MNNRYFLMRHGESQANRANMIISAPETGCRLYGLTARGREQAEASARASQLPAKTLVYCSDFVRAKETATIAAQTLGCDTPVVEEGLRERYFGQLEGEQGERYREVWKQDEFDPDKPLYGAESSRHLVFRLSKVIKRLEEQHKDEDILLVSHGDPLRFLQLWAAERPLTEHLGIKLFEPAEIRALDEPLYP